MKLYIVRFRKLDGKRETLSFSIESIRDRVAERVRKLGATEIETWEGWA